jgi:polar amino acid transport system substrate-binding protein
MKKSRLASLVTLVLSLALVVVLVGACQKQAQPSISDSAFNRVMETNKLRVGYISYPPSFIKDANTGKYSGIFHEVLTEAAKSVGFKVDYIEEVTWGTMVEAVDSGRVDLVCTAVWPTGARARRAEFTAPIYYSPVRAYVRANDTRFDSDISKANNSNIKIATIDGEMSSIIAQSDYKNATQDSLPQSTDISQLFLEVANNKADITFAEVAVTEAYIKSNPGSIKAVANVPYVRIFPNVMMVGKGEFKLLSTLNVAIDQLANNGTIDQIVARYENPPGSLLRRQLPYKQ